MSYNPWAEVAAELAREYEDDFLTMTKSDMFLAAREYASNLDGKMHKDDISDLAAALWALSGYGSAANRQDPNPVSGL